MRLRNSTAALHDLQRRLKKTGHPPDDPYAKAMLTNFWDKVRYDKRLARGEI